MGRSWRNHVRDPFALFARVYDASLPLERPALQLALALADPRPEERLLDVGTGTGALLSEHARRAVHPARMIGIDRSWPMLAAKRQVGCHAWTLALGDGRELPLLGDSVDVVSAGYVLHLLAVQDRQRLLEEICRVVRPGGRVVIITIDTSHPGARWVLSALPSWTTLHRIDARAELVAAGLQVIETRYARTGWPSACLLAHRRV